MADAPPERVTFSIPPDEDLDLDELDELVKASPYGSRSEFIRAAIEDTGEEIVDDVDDESA